MSLKCARARSVDRPLRYHEFFRSIARRPPILGVREAWQCLYFYVLIWSRKSNFQPCLSIEQIRHRFYQAKLKTMFNQHTEFSFFHLANIFRGCPVQMASKTKVTSQCSLNCDRRLVKDRSLRKQTIFFGLEAQASTFSWTQLNCLVFSIYLFTALICINILMIFLLNMMQKIIYTSNVLSAWTYDS